MKRLILIAFLAPLTACTMYSKYKEPGPLDGNWKMVEVKCENGDYTKAGEDLRSYYELPTVERTMFVNRDVMQTKIIQKENSQKGHKDCTTRIETPFTLNGKEITAQMNVLTKESAINSNCKGTRTVKEKLTGTYKLSGDILELAKPGKLKRLNQKDSEDVCENSSLITVFKKL